MNLHIHSEGSFLDGYSRVDDIARRAKELGQPAVALTDHGEVNMHLEFQKACKRHEIFPVFGMEGYYTFDIEASRQAKTKGLDNSHITLLARNQKGLSNLWAWSSKAYEPKYFYLKPQADLALMREHAEGLWASDGCFRGDQRYLTAYGTKTFAETVGTSQKVLGRQAEWVDAEICSFGTQEIYRLVVSRYGVEKEIFTTANHRWFAGNYRTSGGHLSYKGRKEKLTEELLPGDVLQSVFAKKYVDRVSLSPLGIQAGIVFGDGTTVKSKMGRREAKVVLYGEKDASLLKWFPLNQTTSSQQKGHSVAQIEVRGLPGYFKDTPDLRDSSLGYLYGWLAGYFAADGCVTKAGSAVLNSTSLSSLEFAQDVCHLLGVRTGRISATTRTVTPPKGVPRESIIYGLRLNMTDLRGEFFLVDQHRDRFWEAFDRKEQTWADWKVKSVEPTGHTEEVFCAVVPQGHAFVLEDNILTGNCMLTEFARNVERGDESRCREIYAALLSVFREFFYIELHPWQFCNPQSPEEQNLNAQMTRLNHAKIRLSQELGIPMVVVNDAHYAWPKDWENHALVWEFNTKGNSDQTARGQTAAWMMSDDEMVHWMAQHGVSRSITEEAIKNSFLIAESCTAEIVPTLEMPRLTASERDDVEMFINLVEQGFKDKVVRAGLPEDVYGPRMISEIDVIAERDFCGYFNIVSDYVKACKTGKYIQYVQPGSDPDPLIIGPGRGSAGGSLVAYLMDITTVDPIKYDLSFNRFISPGRKGLPDIDVDVPQSKRLDIKQYFAYRYGQDHVCGIGTRSRSQPRAMLADLCRVMGIPFMDRKKMSDILDEVSDIEEDETASWDEVLSEKGGDLAPWANKYPDLFRKMGEMVGLARQSGTHAAGILVSSKPIQGNLPTRVKNDQVVSQLDMHEVEELGAVKLDVLGLRHLDTLSVARNLIHERHGILLDYYNFGDKEFSDPAIWEQIDKGQTTGIFQLETASGTKVATEFKPRNEIDVAVLSAINRPGVIRAGLLNHYLWRRSGTEEISFDHPLMEELVGDTCGILVYQEQLTRAAEVLAGFTPQEADDLRKLIGKKEIDRLGPMKVKFIEGCLGNDAFTSVMANQQSAVKAAEKIWMSFEASGSYAFNKSHAIEYGTISSWEIWTKHYYPKEFLTALMQTDSGNINRYVREARRKGIPILPPDINLSGRKFTLVDNEIRYGLDSVFAVGNSATTDILEKRPFGSLDDFLNRTDGRGANRKQVIINLIMIGAFDRFGDRATLLKSYYETRKDCGDLTIPDFSDEDVLYKIEQELVGNYVTIDPMEKYVRALEAVALRHPSDVNDVSIMDRLVIGGQITKIKHHKTKRGRDMAFLVVSWNEEDFDVTVFPEEWSSCQNLLKVGAPVACQCIRLERGCCLQALERLDLMEWT